MSVDEPDPPVHRISRIEDREQLLAEALADVETRDERYRIAFTDGPKRGRWKVPVSLLVFAVAGTLALFPPALAAPPPLPTPAVAQRERGLRIAVLLQAKQVEVFRVRRRRLPDDLSELPIHLPGLRFVRSNGRVYQILGRRTDGSTLVYDSARPPPSLDRAAAAWLGDGAP